MGSKELPSLPVRSALWAGSLDDVARSPALGSLLPSLLPRFRAGLCALEMWCARLLHSSISEGILLRGLALRYPIYNMNSKLPSL